MMDNVIGKKYSRICGYSTRHVRRIVQKRLNNDRKDLKMARKLPWNSIVNSFSDGASAAVECISNVGPGLGSNVSEPSTEFAGINYHPDSSESDKISEHSYSDDQFLYSDVTSECSLSEDEPSQLQDDTDELSTEDSFDREMSKMSLESNLKTKSDDGSRGSNDNIQKDDYMSMPFSNLHEEESSEEGNSLRKKLHKWALLFRIPLVALTALLFILRTIPFVNLPLDGRTLVGTLRHTKIYEICGGEYYHFGLERAVKAIVRENIRKGKKMEHVKLMCHIDGLPISKSGGESFWLILGSEMNSEKVYPIGAYYGIKKPTDANEFLKQFVEEAIELSKNGLKDTNIKVSCETLICDAPAKSFVFYLKGHTGYDSCSKCLITGQYFAPKVTRKNGKRKGRICFPGIGPFRMMNDEDFARNLYQNFDSENESILKTIPGFGCISSVPIDYMHLVLLGVMKKLIQLWLTGPLKVRLSAINVNIISQKLLTLRHSTPSEFGRKPRSLMEYSFWKATEFRTFLLYTGPVVLKNILSAEMYSNFLLLHTAVSILVSETHFHTLTNINYAHELLENFVIGFARIYGKEYVSQNVHNLLHICCDVKKYGVLDKYSAFRFENYMSTIKGMIRKGDKPLEQIARRYAEMEAAEEDSHLVPETSLQQSHNNGPLIENFAGVKKQYKLFKNKSYSIDGNTDKNSCVLFKDGTFATVKNIVKLENNEILLIGKKMVQSEKLYDGPDSRLLNIHIMVNTNEAEYSWSLDEVLTKAWKIPCQKGKILIPLLYSI